MATFTVTNTNNSGFGSLRQAVSNANASNGADRIVFDESLRGSTINLTSGQIRITESLTLEGLGAENLTIDAGGNSRVFFVDNINASLTDIDFIVEDITITGGFTSGSGGAILAVDTITNDINVTISNSAVVGNSAANDGGAIYFDSKNGQDRVRISNSFINGNSAGNAGGGVFAKKIVIFGSTISENSAVVGGGGVFTRNGFAFVSSSNFVDNTTQGFGGGIAGQDLRLLTSTFSNNRAGISGGAIRTEGAAVIINSNINENEADENGGGISVNRLPLFSLPGGKRRAIIANTTISGNKAKGNGGGIEVVGGIVQLVPFGKVRVPAILEATNVTITNNLADSDNNGVGSGGGISNFPSEVFGDFETERFILTPGEITFKNSIIAGNFDTPNNNGIGFIAPDINGAARGNANNLLGNTQGLTIESSVAPASESLAAGSDLSNVDPRLGILQDNGGRTQTIELLPGSPAIDGGDNNNILRETIRVVDGLQPLIFNFDGDPNTTNVQLPYDQRSGSFSRIVNGTVDIGAFEVQDLLAPCEPTNGDDDLTACATPNDDSIAGLEGNDTLVGGNGNDTLQGNEGNDLLVGDSNSNTLLGSGNDFLYGGNGDDGLYGGNGNDFLYGGNGNDFFGLNSGNDYLDGGSGIDTVGYTSAPEGIKVNLSSTVSFGIVGNRAFDGFGGQDTLFGIENINGSKNNDLIIGNDSNNTLFGDAGNDTLYSLGGDDTLNGGDGNDIFVFKTGKVFDSSNLGVDLIVDFVTESDLIHLSKNTFTALDNTSNGRLINPDFEIVTSNALVRGSSAEIVYNSSNGNLFYNENNEAAGLGRGGLFARLVGSPDNLSARDFQVVDV